VDPVQPHPAYGGDVIEASAEFADGTREQWLVRWDSSTSLFEWVRQPLGPPRRCRFSFELPIQPERGDFISHSAGLASAKDFDSATLAQERGLFAHPAGIRGGMFLHLGLGGALDLAAASPSETASLPPHAAARAADRCWTGTWTPPVSRMVRFSVTLGTPPSVRAEAEASGQGAFSDASLDFGAFYSHAAAFALRDLSRPYNNAIASLRETAFGCEFYYLLAPERARKRLCAVIETLHSRDAREYDDESAALALLMAGRVYRLGGADAAVQAWLPWLESLGQRILALRRPGEALPICEAGGLTGYRVKEPIFCAMAQIGLSRLADMLAAFGQSDTSGAFAEAAEAMRWAAIAPYESEGLWDPSRKGYVQALVYEGLERASQESPVALCAYRHGENMIPLWLGLYPEKIWAETVLEQIDYRYTHALGRGDWDLPPEGDRTFYCLLEALMRHRLDRPHAHRLLQRVIDTTHGSAPFPAAWNRPGAPRDLVSGAPYFGLALRGHYGLDYSREGWHLGTPRPLENYPLTRVTGLRHRFATLNITWQGKGRVQRVLVNGAAVARPDAPLAQEKGEHEVTVILG
jgi:hypothetical protein